MSEKLQKILATLSPADLSDIICQIHASGKDEKTLVNQLIAAYDPKELHKLLNKQITSIKASKRFLGYYEVNELAYKLDRLNTSIKTSLVQQAPDLAIKLCKRLISIDESIFGRADDSNGSLSDCYMSLYELLDQAFVNSDESADAIAQYLFDIYTNDEYGNRGHILDFSKQSLKKNISEPLEKLANATTLKDYQRSNLLKAIADAQDDVDKFIAVTTENGTPHDRDIIDIAQRLNKAFRGSEAIEWLNKINTSGSHYNHDKDSLLIEAYRLEGEDSKAQQVLWSRFERNLSAGDYLTYLKRATPEQQQIAKQQALVLASKANHLEFGLQFLYDIQEFALVDELILKNADKIDGSNYFLYRKLSTDLAKHGKCLSATLLRRELILGVLEKANSTYYKYAVSDLKKANEFSAQVTHWQDHLTQDAFMDLLKDKHQRKVSFWGLVAAL